jgi:DNA-binding MarR family transcriptional regulator
MTLAMAKTTPSKKSAAPAAKSKPAAKKATAAKKAPARATSKLRATAKPAAKSKPAAKVPAAKPVVAKSVPAKQADTAQSAIQALHEVLSAFDHAAARELSLNRSDVACLRLLGTGPKKAREIGVALGLTSGSVTALVDRLEAGKHVKRSVSDADRRAIQVELTAPSARRLAKAYEPLEDALSRSLGAQKKATIDAIHVVASALAGSYRELVASN